MKLIISNVSGVPIYEQIKQQVKAAILSGELKEEEALPSLRTLAKDLKISVLTVTRAYTCLLYTSKKKVKIGYLSAGRRQRKKAVVQQPFFHA